MKGRREAVQVIIFIFRAANVNISCNPGKMDVTMETSPIGHPIITAAPTLVE